MVQAGFKARITHQHLVGDAVFEYEVHFDGWSTMWDESVLEDGLRFEDAVSVECCWAGVPRRNRRQLLIISG